LAPEELENSHFDKLDELIKVYLSRRRNSDRPTRAAIAIPAIVTSDRVDLSDPDWSFSKQRLQDSLGLRMLRVVYDLESAAWALPELQADSFHQIGGGAPSAKGPFGLICPDHELRVVSLIANSDGWLAVHSHGGLVSLAATTAEEADVLARVRERYGQCTAQHIISVAGLVNIYRALSEIAGRGPAKASCGDVLSLAKRREPLASKALAMFFMFLATFSRDLALTIGARGGIYVGGALVPRVLYFMQHSKFRERFEGSRGVANHLKEIPTRVITAPLPELDGLRLILGYSWRGAEHV